MLKGVLSIKKAPQGVYILILRTCVYVTLHDQRDLIGEIKVKDLEMRLP